jgi:hypothetical protein
VRMKSKVCYFSYYFEHELICHMMRSVHFQVNIVSVIGNYHLMVAFFGGVDSVIYRPLIVL